MSVNETQRFEMYLEFRKLLGDDVTNTLMEHLPPEGWGDIARSRDLDRLSDRITHVDQRLFDHISHVETELGSRITRVEQRLKGITGTLWIMIGSIVTMSSALLVMMIQLNSTIAGL